MIRHIFFLFAFSFFALELVLAQVAAPTLLPIFVPENPAVLQRLGQSRIGAGWNQGDSEITDSSTVPPTVSEGDFSGFLVGLSLNGENISFGVQGLEAEFTEGTEVTVDLSFSSAAIAIPIGDFLTLGIGQENVEIEATFDNGALRADRNLEATTPLAGVSLKLGNVFYLGAAFGRETAEAIQTTVPSIPALNFNAEWERDVMRYGAAIYDTEGTKWHLEVGVTKKDSTTDTVSNFPIDESKETFAVIEVIAGGYLIGLKAKDLEESDESVTPASVNVTEETRELTLGWVPESGWSLTLIVSEIERDEPGNNTNKKDSSTALLLSFLF